MQRLKSLGVPRRRQRGTAAVEMALILPVMLLLSFGVADYGRAIYTYNTLVKAARSAARHLAIADALPSAALREQARAEALYLARYGQLEDQGEPLAPGLAPGMPAEVRVCTADACAEPCADLSGVGVNLVSVCISGYEHRSLLSALTPATLVFNDIVATMRGRP